MAGKLIRTIDRWRFERPLGAALGAATLFAMMAMPAPRYAAVPLVGRIAQPVGALVLAILLAVVGWVAMRRPAPAPARRVRKVAPAADVLPDISASAEEEPAVRLRRADRHPDAPARAPIRAHRDLGSPFMEVDTAPPPPIVVDLPPPPPIDLDALTVARPPITEEPIAEPAVAEAASEENVAGQPAAPFAETPAIELNVLPLAEARPAPAASRGRTDLNAMIERLAAGFEQRSAKTASRRPPAALVGALEELNRIAARRR
ncbi:hypothetical protein [Sphingomonas sp.]|uniref:hypothetical protein n=1 Tax=Sphingomonas sp. TaxID=28214 RepID=UPI003B00D115